MAYFLVGLLAARYGSYLGLLCVVLGSWPLWVIWPFLVVGFLSDVLYDWWIYSEVMG